MQRLGNFIKRLFIGFDLGTVEGKLRLAILVVGIILIVGAAGLGVVNATSQSKFCSSCHEMTPEYVTWQASSHSQVDCINCHVGPGLGNLLKDKVGALSQIYQHVTDSYATPIEIKEPIKNYICQDCHSPNRKVTVDKDIIIPHDRHEAAGVECVACHSGVAHGKVAERGLTKDKNWSAWTVSTGAKQLQEFGEPQMETCMQCHQERKVSNSCNTCHRNISPPASHQQASWSFQHGVAAREDFSTCSQCHLATGKEKPQDVVAYAASVADCRACHSQRPPNHQTSGWTGQHKNVVAAKGMDYCKTCHNIKENDRPNPASKVYCDQCHQF